MKMYSIRLVMCVCCVLLLPGLAGCAAYAPVDLKDMELAQALAVDVAEDAFDGAFNKGAVQATVWLLHRDKALEPQYADSCYQVAARAGDLSAALAALPGTVSRQINLSHMGLLVLGDAVSPAVCLGQATLSTGIRPTVYPLVARGRAAALLSTNADPAPVYSLQAALEPDGTGRAGAMAVSLQQFAIASCQPGLAPVLPYADFEPELGIWGLAVWDDTDKSWQFIPQGDECLAWRILLNFNKIKAEIIDFDDGTVLQITDVKVKKEVDSTNWQGKIRLDAMVLANPCELSPNELGNCLNNRILAVLQGGFMVAQRMDLDFLGLGRDIWRQQPDVWQNIAEYDYLSSITAKFDVKTTIKASAKGA